jgi:hypothetical protein
VIRVIRCTFSQAPAHPGPAVLANLCETGGERPIDDGVPLGGEPAAHVRRQHQDGAIARVGVVSDSDKQLIRRFELNSALSMMPPYFFGSPAHCFARSPK